MKRFAAGALAPLLLSGLVGCISFAPQSGSEGKKDAKPNEARQGDMTPYVVPNLPPAGATTQLSMPSAPSWVQTPEHHPHHAQQPQLARAAMGEHNVARPNIPNRPQPPQTTPPNALQQPVPANGTQFASLQPTALGGVSPTMTQPATTPVVQPQPKPVATPRQPMPSAELVQSGLSAITPANADVIQGKHELTLSPAPKAGPEIVTTPAPRTMPTMPPTPAVKTTTPETTQSAGEKTDKPEKSGMPLIRMVNTKRITLNFEVKGTGDSGVSGVELWWTQDSKEWRKYDAPPGSKAYVVEVEEEGMYGFTLIARSGTGNAKDPPQPGDSPQVWVIVDLTKPDVQLTEVLPNMKTGPQQVSIKWKASDKNLGRQPITLSYATASEGPWRVIAANLENSGSYIWEVPQGTPPKVLIRVDVQDLAGNMGRTELNKVIVLDNKRPNVVIIGVDTTPTN